MDIIHRAVTANFHRTITIRTKDLLSAAAKKVGVIVNFVANMQTPFTSTINTIYLARTKAALIILSINIILITIIIQIPKPVAQVPRNVLHPGPPLLLVFDGLLPSLFACIPWHLQHLYCRICWHLTAISHCHEMFCLLISLSLSLSASLTSFLALFFCFVLLVFIRSLKM